MTTTLTTTAEKIKCCDCQHMLPITDFGRDCSRKSGLAARCKPCNRRQIKGFGKHVPMLRDPSLVQPRQISVMQGQYTPPRDVYYRNNGNKHLKSFGYFC